MHNTNTRSWKKRSLSQFVHEDDGTLTLFALFSLGLIAALMHQELRMGLNIPGRHGLEWMTLLLFGRMQSRYCWAGVMVASGAAIMYLTQASIMPLAHTVKPALVYMLNGVCLDLLFRVTPKKLPVFIKGMIMGGITFIMKPLILVPAAVFILEVGAGSFNKHGYLFPILTHFAFGSVGAVCGISLAGLMTSSSRKHPADDNG